MSLVETQLEIAGIGKRLSGEEFHPDGEGLLSKDGVVAIYPRGYFEQKFRQPYSEIPPSALVEKNGRVGDGKSWFDKRRLENILKCLEKEKPKLMTSKANMPAIVLLEKAEVVLAPHMQ